MTGRKVLRITAGLVLLGIGLILSVPLVPGPGFLFVFAGLALLADHFTWARRLLEWGKRKVEGLRSKPKPNA